MLVKESQLTPLVVPKGCEEEQAALNISTRVPPTPTARLTRTTRHRTAPHCYVVNLH